MYCTTISIISTHLNQFNFLYQPNLTEVDPQKRFIPPLSSQRLFGLRHIEKARGDLRDNSSVAMVTLTSYPDLQ
jgi:hypothetical protein